MLHFPSSMLVDVAMHNTSTILGGIYGVLVWLTRNKLKTLGTTRLSIFLMAWLVLSS